MHLPTRTLMGHVHLRALKFIDVHSYALTYIYMHLPVPTLLCINLRQKPIRVETCNGPLCAGKQASEYSIC